MSSKRILVIAEGEKAEKAFLDAMKGAFHFSYTFCCLRGNIYHLYTKLSLTKFDMATYAASGPQIDSASISGSLSSQ